MRRRASSTAFVLVSLAPTAALGEVPRLEAHASFSAGLRQLPWIERFAATLAAGYAPHELVALDLVGVLFVPAEIPRADPDTLLPHPPPPPELLWGSAVALRLTPIRGSVAVRGIDEPSALRLDVSVGFGLGQSRRECEPGLAIDPETFGRKADGTAVTCKMIETASGDDAVRAIYEPNLLHPIGMIAFGARFPIFEPLGLRVGVRDWIFPTRVFRPGSGVPPYRFTDAIQHDWTVEVGLSALM